MTVWHVKSVLHVLGFLCLVFTLQNNDLFTVSVDFKLFTFTTLFKKTYFLTGGNVC